ncbi:MAG: DUF5752 family protein [Candidatus Heimdallarchaeaceae archaeon]
MNITTLKILAKIASDKKNLRFNFVSPTTKEIICSAATLEELYECILKLKPEVIKNHVTLCGESEQDTRDLAFWVHYILADTELSMKIYTVAEQNKEDSDKLKLELINILFTRLLNFTEISFLPD